MLLQTLSIILTLSRQKKASTTWTSQLEKTSASKANTTNRWTLTNRRCLVLRKNNRTTTLANLQRVNRITNLLRSHQWEEAEILYKDILATRLQRRLLVSLNAMSIIEWTRLWVSRGKAKGVKVLKNRFLMSNHKLVTDILGSLNSKNSNNKRKKWWSKNSKNNYKRTKKWKDRKSSRGSNKFTVSQRMFKNLWTRWQKKRGKLTWSSRWIWSWQRNLLRVRSLHKVWVNRGIKHPALTAMLIGEK